MEELIQRVGKSIRREGLLADGACALVAVSGGVDSMVLLHVMHELSMAHRWKLVVAHFNHRLRGRAADADARLVQRTVKKLGLRCECASADVKEFARARKLSVEMAARELRHEFLARTALSLGLSRVALAHHADDQVELFFLRLLRGASSEGLAGMRWQSASPSDKAIMLIRPLLDEPKAALVEFARRHRVAFREDASNQSQDIPRNRVRRELLPLLRRNYQPNLDAIAYRTMDLLRAEAEFITSEAERWLSTPPLKTKPFATLPVAVQRRVLQLELRHARVAVEFDLIEQLRLNAGAWTVINAQWLCRRLPSGRVETCRAVAAESFRDGHSNISLGAKTRRAEFALARFSWSFARGARRPPASRQAEFFDADKVGDEIILRHWRPGDRFQPIGLAHSMKLQDFFVNQKIPRARRYGMVIAATAGGEIFWVEGLRISDKFKVTARTKRVLQWKWRVETQVAVTKGG